MYQKLKILFITTVFITTLLITGCRPPSAGGGGMVELRVTRDYGNEILFAETVEAMPGQSVLSLMEEHLEVDYAYGGRFINAIEGVRSGYTGAGGGAEKKDWFFYANGILCGTGAADYYPGEGDVIWWDYNPWDGSLFVPAVVGAFPQPFINGYRGNNPGVLIMHGKENRYQAETLNKFFMGQGAGDTVIKSYSEADVMYRSFITLVIAPWHELKDESFWQGLQENRDKTGLFVEFSEAGIIPLDEQGRRPDNVQPAEGAVIATGSGMGDGTPLWLITAPDNQKLGEIVDLVTSSPDSLYGASGAVMTGDVIINLPFSIK